MKSDLVRLIETLELKYEQLQAENMKLKRKMNRMLKAKRQQSLKHHNHSSFSTYAVDTENSFIRNSVLSHRKIHDCPNDIQSCKQMCKTLHEQQLWKEIPVRKKSSKKIRHFNKKLVLQTNVRV